MGMSNVNVALILAALTKGAAIQKAATLGMQAFWPDKNELQKILIAFGYNASAEEIFKNVGGSGSKFLEFLGAQDVTEFDASDYEGAKVVHDMNKPIPVEWHEKFDFIYDGGTIEHIYNVPQVVENLGNMLRIGGHLVISTTGNNLFGHGFYQFSPEFFYRVFSEENGWNTKIVLLAEPQIRPPKFWEVIDPKIIQERIELKTQNQVYTMIITEKISSNFIFQIPQQSDYAAAWNLVKNEKKGAGSSAAKKSIIHRVLYRAKWETFQIRKKLSVILKKCIFYLRPKCELRNNRNIREISLSELAGCKRQNS